MKKIYTLIAVVIPFLGSAQSGIITTIDSTSHIWVSDPGGAGSHTESITIDLAGNIYANDWNTIYKITPTGSHSIIAGLGMGPGDGDGGPAIDARLDIAGGCIVCDPEGNIYIADGYHHRIRKIDTAGIITTVVGTGVVGYSGDGGPAIAAQLNWPKGIALDIYGNLYFSEFGNHRIRKVNTAGIITTVAGNGSSVISGDGGPATSAGFGYVKDIAVDGFGNLFVLGDSSIRKINAAGIINTITSVTSNMYWGFPYSGDGGASTAALSEGVWDIDADVTGNVFMACRANGVIRKINTSGIISTIVGIPAGSIGECLWGGDGGTASSARVCIPAWVATHPTGELYLAHDGGERLRKISEPPTFSSGSFYAHLYKTCYGLEAAFRATVTGTGYKVKTYFGDGSISTVDMLPGYGEEVAISLHNYSIAGSYTVKHLLMGGSIVIDTISYTVHHESCSEGLSFDDHWNNSYGIGNTSSTETTFSPFEMKPIQPNLYPDPVTEALTIKTNGLEYSTAVIVNVVGQTVLSMKLNGSQTNVDVSHLPQGIYHARLEGNNGTFVKTIVKL